MSNNAPNAGAENLDLAGLGVTYILEAVCA